MGHPELSSSCELATRSGSGSVLDVVGLASQMARNLSHGNLTNSSDASAPPENSGNGLPPLHRPGSHTSLQGLDPTSDRQWEAPGKNSDYSGREAPGRAPGLPLLPNQGGAEGDDIFANALGGLDLNDRSSGGSLNSMTAGGPIQRPLSHNNLSEAAEPEMRPRSLVINNLTDAVSDEVLQQELESYGDVQTLYTGCKGQGNVMVTFYDCAAAARAKAALSGRSVSGRVLDVDYHNSTKDAQQGRVYLFNVEDGIPDHAVKGQMELYGPVMFVRKHPAVPMCREIYFQDVRVANQAYQALYGGQPLRVPTISENGGDLNVDSQSPMRNVQSSHTLQSYSGRDGVVPEVDGTWGGRPRSWDNSLQPNDMARMMSQSGHTYSSPDVLALLNQAPPEALDQLVRSGYLPNNASSNSLQGLGSSSALRMMDSQGSTSNLSGLGGMSGSASHPDLAAALLAAQNESPDRAGLPVGNSRGLSSPPLPQLPGGPRAQLSADQIAALQGSGLLGGLGQGANRARRGMSTPDLTALAQAAQVQAQLNQVQNLGSQRASVPGFGGGLPLYGANQFGSSDSLTGWGANMGNLGGQGQGLDPATLLAAQSGFGMGNLGALQRSVSALHLQQYQQQQQQQLLLQQLGLANMNPQALAQLASLQRGSGAFGPGNQHRGKMFRGDENPVGGRLSRRAADPVVEAERKAQQERHFAMDLDKVERGEDPRTTLMIKNIPNKYTQKMLLQTIDEQFSRMYDFFYLPIDFKNKCNVGYAFINMVKPAYIIPLMKRFNQKKWERFNSEKVCHISYARIQGKSQLVTHFQNSSLLHEDKRCRPILFRSDGDLAGEQEPFPTGNAANRGHRPRSAGLGPGFPDGI